MRKIIFILLALLPWVADAKVDPCLKQAYKYRTDIGTDVVKLTKQWDDGVGIIHNDWIENRNGRSIDIQGNVMFPDYDYVGLQQLTDSLFVMQSRAKKLGLVTRSGKSILPCNYDEIDFSYQKNGLLLGVETDGNIFDAKTKSADVYTLDGTFMMTFPTWLYHIVMHETFGRSIAELSYDEGDDRKIFLYYLNGDKACNETLMNGKVEINKYDSSNFRFKKDNETIQIPFSTDNTKIYPKIDENEETAKLDAQAKNFFYNNLWMQKAVEFYNADKYEDALFCINYYAKYKQNLSVALKNHGIYSYGLENYIVYPMLLSSYLYNKEYSSVMNIVSMGFKERGKDYPYYHMLIGLHYDMGSNTLRKEDNYDSFIAGIKNYEYRTYVDNSVNACIAIYNEAKQRYEQKQANTVMLLNSILGALTNIASNNSASQQTTNPSGSSSATVAPVSTGVDYAPATTTTSSSSSTKTATRSTCTRCGGSGLCIRCNGSGKETTFSGKSLTTCGACNGKGKCLSCNGQGYHNY